MSINLHMDDYGFRKLVRAHPKHVQYLTDVPMFSTLPLGWVLHVVEGNGSPYDMFNRNVVGERKFSTGWVGKNGRVELYGSLFRESWAQVAGNTSYWSFETEGFTTEPLTNPQLWALARIHAALQIAAGQDYNHLANHPGEHGIGTHSMGGAAWGGHACPGTIRAAQRQLIIDRSKRFIFRRG